MLLFNPDSRRAMFRLAAFAAVSIVLLSLSYLLLKGRIAAQQQAHLLSSFSELYQERPLGPELLDSARPIDLGGLPVILYQAKDGDRLLASFIHTHSNKGYNGRIDLLIAIAPDQRHLLGVRVLSHKETPGLGDKIERRVSSWIEAFAGQSLASRSFRVKKDGGDFDAFSGATITPRAVTEQVGQTLRDWQAYTEEQDHGR